MKQSPTHVTRMQSLKDPVDTISKKKLPNGFATFRGMEADPYTVAYLILLSTRLTAWVIHEQNEVHQVTSKILSPCYVSLTHTHTHLSS